MNLQQTIRRSVECRGVGLHTGTPVTMTLAPARADHGMVFRVRPSGVEIPVRPQSLLNGHYATTIGAGDVQLQTVEHFLAAARALGVDNLLVDVDGPELPAVDGSAAPFVALLEAAGRESQPAVRRPLAIDGTVRVGDDARWLQVTPSDELRISYTLDLDHPAVGVQVVSVIVTERRFVEEVAPARTYGFLKDLALLREQGLALGGSLANAVVLGPERILNDGLRFEDEFVRHKILDLIGDLALLGQPLLGHVVARNAGHALNHTLVREIARRRWEGERDLAAARVAGALRPVGLAAHAASRVAAL